MASIFTKIIQKEIPCEKIFESENEIAFMDIAPWMLGHTLVVPKKEVAKLEELTSEEAASLMITLQTVAKAVSAAYDGVDYKIILNNGANAGQEVPHVHFHIIPSPPEPRFSSRIRYEYGEGEMKKIGEMIRNCLQ